MNRDQIMQGLAFAMTQQNVIGGGRCRVDPDLRAWTPYRINNMSITYLDGVNTFTATMKPGYEKLYFPLNVDMNRDYRLLVRFSGAFTENNPDPGHHVFIAVDDTEPTWSSYIEGRTVMGKTRIYSGNDWATYTLDFQSGARHWVYVFFDFAAVTDEDTVTFEIAGLTLMEIGVSA